MSTVREDSLQALRMEQAREGTLIALIGSMLIWHENGGEAAKHCSWVSA